MMAPLLSPIRRPGRSSGQDPAGEPLRILAINWRDPWDSMGGGAEVHLHEILRRLVMRGHQVTWLSSTYPGAPSEEVGNDGIGYRRRGDWRLANFTLPMLLRDELRRRPYDIVLEDLNKIPFYTPLFTRLPVLAVVPHLFGSTVYRETNPLLATYVYASELPIPWIYRRSRFLVISESTRDDLMRRGIRVERIEVIPCGIDHERYRHPDPPARNSEPTLLYLGRLKKYKSIDVAIRALALIRRRLPRAVLNIVGVGPERARLDHLAQKLGLSGAVRFLGYLSRSEVIDHLYRSHILLNPSPKEGWGLTVIEANQCGMPVVASRRPGLVDSVKDGETGLLAEYGDPEDFSRKALTLLENSTLWRSMSVKAIRWARSFSWEEAAERTEALLKLSVEEACTPVDRRARPFTVEAGKGR